MRPGTPLTSGESGGALLYAIVLAGVVGMLGMGALVLQQTKGQQMKSLERREELDELRTLVRHDMVCGPTVRAVCEKGQNTLILRGRQLDAGRYTFVSRETKPETVRSTDARKWRWLVSAECEGGGVRLYYAATSKYGVAKDPLSGRAFSWRPLTQAPLCGG